MDCLLLRYQRRSVRHAYDHGDGRPGGFDVRSESGRDVRRELAAAVVGRGWGLLELRPVRKSLEDVFINLTTEEEPQADEPATEDAHE